MIYLLVRMIYLSNLCLDKQQTIHLSIDKKATVQILTTLKAEFKIGSDLYGLLYC